MPNCEPCDNTAPKPAKTSKWNIGYDTYEMQYHVDAPIDPLRYNADAAAADYVVNQIAEDLAAAISLGNPTGAVGAVEVGHEAEADGGASIPSEAEISEMVSSALSDAGATSSVSPNEVAAKIRESLTGGGMGNILAAINALAGIVTIAEMLVDCINGAFGYGGAGVAITSTSGGGGGGGGGADDGGGGGGEETVVKEKAMEFLNDLDFLYKEFQIDPSVASVAIKDVEFPWKFEMSLMQSKTYELLSKSLSTYKGYNEDVLSVHFPNGFPNISPPGKYSFEDSIETQLEKVKRRALKSIQEAQILLLVVPTLFTFDPNRTREANRRCRTLKSKIFKVISLFPTMLDLWDGVGEWTTTYNRAGNIDRFQLFFEAWGGYLNHSNMAPRLVRDSVARKNFTEDRMLIQGTYNQENDFFQYCMSNAYEFEEFVENSHYETTMVRNPFDFDSWALTSTSNDGWGDAKLEYKAKLVFGVEHPGVPTTTYKTNRLNWVGEKLKGDQFFHTVVMPAAQPFLIAKALINMSAPLVEYLFHKAEITKIDTYDWNNRIDFRRLALADYRGYKRMNAFKHLDRSGLDVINDE